MVRMIQIVNRLLITSVEAPALVAASACEILIIYPIMDRESVRCPWSTGERRSDLLLAWLPIPGCWLWMQLEGPVVSHGFSTFRKAIHIWARRQIIFVVLMLRLHIHTIFGGFIERFPG
jgi:hypothetical protein